MSKRGVPADRAGGDHRSDEALATGLEPDLQPGLIWATMVRVYLTESDHGLKPLLKCLHDELGVLGATVTRGVAGFGASGVVHSAGLVDLSTDLPLVLEFFDRPDRARVAIERIKDFVEPGHVVSWSVSIECGDAASTTSGRH
jgi:PII-like signaling protein